METSSTTSVSAVMLPSSSEATPSSQQCYHKSSHNLRYYTAKELAQTEENYVNTLLSILKVNGLHHNAMIDW